MARQLIISPLFYSMDLGETKGEHGGVHEAAIGLSIFAGRAIGAAARMVFPQHPDADVWAVSGLLCCALTGILAIRWRYFFR